MNLNEGKKVILVTGSTDGIGKLAAKMLIEDGHYVLLHGRNPQKLDALKEEFSDFKDNFECFQADFSMLTEVDVMSNAIKERFSELDVIINNAGIYKVLNPILECGIDVRFMVNTIAPYRLTQNLLCLLSSTSRVINIVSCSQQTVEIDALLGKKRLKKDVQAYAQSKLATVMWSFSLAQQLQDTGPIIVAVHPGAMLGTKMVKEAFGVDGKDVQIGADILYKASLSDEFLDSSGKYFDNDDQTFQSPHQDALNENLRDSIVKTVERISNSF
eukprot:TRINITY_DN1307_c0_g1_i1.p1 TRINITY_DN1307_c0_g1~~TRINITY_DN1307_c0_g1_i1.p1  ORF type:complete len:272 (-),score=57.71 TRINITY_DN1307_c0_g1_i1:47-862(-)